jgi:DNA-directed RNA polymerase I, II, and III subunit RPABC2
MSAYDDENIDVEEEEEEEEDDEPKPTSLPKPSKVDDVSDDEEEDDESDDESDNEEDDGDDDVSTTIFPTQTEQLRPFASFDESSDESDNEEDDNDNYLQKFTAETQRQIITDFHPELKTHNYDEVDILSRVVRNENGVVIDPLHKTLPFVTKYEKARILGERAKQLNSGAKAFIEVDPSIIDGYLIALKEFEQKVIPFILKRPLPNGGCEYWKFADLEILE